MINYNNLSFKTGNPIIKNYDFLKMFGTFYDLLLDLLNEGISTIEAAKEQSVIRNALKLYGRITIIINAFVNKFIYPGDVEEDVYHSLKYQNQNLKKV